MLITLPIYQYLRKVDKTEVGRTTGYSNSNVAVARTTTAAAGLLGTS